jgi:hypothetical protein
MLLLDAETWTHNAIQAHYDALIVQLFGARASGLSRSRLSHLLRGGYLAPSQIEGLRLGHDDAPLNPLIFLRMCGTPYATASAEEQAQMREWTLSRWSAELEDRDPSTPSQAVSPLPEGARALPPEIAPKPLPRAVPESLSTTEKIGLVSAFQSAGGFIRGLGAKYAYDASADYYEEWNGETLVSSPDPIQRRERLEIIREEVGLAQLTKDHAREVARRMRARTGDLYRNFDRIAETELQATHNEGMIYQAVSLDGENARVKRIPESGACRACLGAFLDEEGQPIIWSVQELAEMGSNVGRRRAEWLPSAYPMHPSCRCDTIPVLRRE